MDPGWPQNWPTKAEELHIFDPKGDVLLLLGRRLPREQSGVAIEEYGPEEPILDEAAPKEPILEEATPEEPIPEEAALEELSPATPEDAAPDAIESELELESMVQQVQLRVSSKHLILASRTFSTSLESFSAGHMLQTEGNVTMKLPDDDPDVMIILLNIIHGQNKRVPRRVSLDMLTKLAAAVNYHQVHEAAELFSEIWMKDLMEKSLPTSYTPEVLPWLFIFWVFRNKDGFRDMTQILQESDRDLEVEANAVPEIPASIINTIQTNRTNIIKNLLQIIHDLIAKYSGAAVICDNRHWNCDAFVLGTIIKSLTAMGFLAQPEHPYPGLAYKDIVNQIKEIRIPLSCGTYNRKRHSFNFYEDNSDMHGIKKFIEVSMRSLEDDMYGLELDDFLPTQNKERIF